MIDALDLSMRTKLKMKEFVKLVSKGNLDTVASAWSNKTYKKYLKLFNEHNINPITIPPKYRVNALGNLVKRYINH